MYPTLFTRNELKSSRVNYFHRSLQYFHENIFRKTENFSYELLIIEIPKKKFFFNFSSMLKLKFNRIRFFIFDWILLVQPATKWISYLKRERKKRKDPEADPCREIFQDSNGFLSSIHFSSVYGSVFRRSTHPSWDQIVFPGPFNNSTALSVQFQMKKIQ